LNCDQGVGHEKKGDEVLEYCQRKRFLSRRKMLVYSSLFCVAGGPSCPTAAQTTGNTVGKKSSPTILIVGDSLSAEYGLQRGTGWVALLEARLRTEKVAANVVNASISGDTTSGGRSRLPALLSQHQPTHVVIELGGNDALRGLPLTMTENNLQTMGRAANSAGAQVVLVGMQVPPNYGRSYADSFAAVFQQVARAEKYALVPFLLKGVADSPQAESLFQSDRIHPNEKAQATMMANVWPVLRSLLPK
jgi:acyl-CoA thioesterase I